MTECSRVFIDTAPIIYYLQHDKLYFKLANDIFWHFQKSSASLVSSDITIEEYCVRPYKSNDLLLIHALEGFVRDAKIEIVHTSWKIATRAAHIRAEYPAFKAMDSLQIAAAMESGCDLFLTNDKQLRQFDGIRCMTLEQFLL